MIQKNQTIRFFAFIPANGRPWNGRGRPPQGCFMTFEGQVLEARAKAVLVATQGSRKRLDCWIPRSALKPFSDGSFELAGWKACLAYGEGKLAAVDARDVI